MPTDLQLRRVDSLTRPKRRAILVNEESSHADLRGHISKTSGFWGGYYTLLIPITTTAVKPIWIRMLRAFDPDEVAIDTGLGTPNGRVRRAILRDCSPFLDASGEPFLAGDAIYSRGEAGLDVVVRTFGLPTIAKLDLSRLPDIVQLCFSGEFGMAGDHLMAVLEHYAKAAGLRPSEEFVEVKTIEFNPTTQDLSTLAAMLDIVKGRRHDRDEPTNARARLLQAQVSGIAVKEILDALPFEIGRKGIKEYESDPDRPSLLMFSRPDVCVVGSSTSDYCLAHNLARLGWPTTWLPINAPPQPGSERPEDVTATFIADSLVSELRKSRDSCLVTSVSLDHAARTPVVEWLASLAVERLFPFGVFEDEQAKKRATDALRTDVKARLLKALDNDEPDCLHLPLNIPVFDDMIASSRTQFLFGMSVQPIIPKGPPILRPARGKAGWIADIQIEGQGYPRRHELSQKREGAANLGLHGIDCESRVSGVGISFFASRWVVPIGGRGHEADLEPTLESVPPLGIFPQIAAKHGFSLKLSDKGGFLKLMLERSGSLKKLADLLAEDGIRNLFEAFTKEGLSPEEGSISIGTPRRTHITTNAVFDLLSRQKVPNIEGFLERLLTERWIGLGFVLKCETCRAADWYATKDVTEIFSCHRCDQQQATVPRSDPKSKAGGPFLYYRLNELAFRFIDGGGQATARCLGFLEADNREPLFFLPECEFARNADEKPFIEVDFLASWRGDLAVGECRRNWQVSGGDATRMKEKLGKLESLLSELQPGRLVLGSEAPFPQNELISGMKTIAKKTETSLFFVAPEKEGGPWVVREIS